jgi:hypothetical protein
MTFFQHTSIDILISGEAAAYVIYFKRNLSVWQLLIFTAAWRAMRPGRRALARLMGSSVRMEVTWRRLASASLAWGRQRIEGGGTAAAGEFLLSSGATACGGRRPVTSISAHGRRRMEGGDR